MFGYGICRYHRTPTFKIFTLFLISFLVHSDLRINSSGSDTQTSVEFLFVVLQLMDLKKVGPFSGTFILWDTCG
jgi:hypothetical protein